MDETIAEKKVGDIFTRKRKISDLLQDDDCENIAYGPLTLTMDERNDIIHVVDFDSIVFNPIHVPESPIDEQVNHVVTEADDRIDEMFNQL